MWAVGIIGKGLRFQNKGRIADQYGNQPNGSEYAQ